MSRFQTEFQASSVVNVGPIIFINTRRLLFQCYRLSSAYMADYKLYIIKMMYFDRVFYSYSLIENATVILPGYKYQAYWVDAVFLLIY